MKKIEYNDIYRRVKDMILHTLAHVDQNVCGIMQNLNETNRAAKWALDQIIANNDLAARTNSPACQDTGLAVFFVEYGQEIEVTGGYIEDALNSAVRDAYFEGSFRKSVAHPLSRKNTGDNTPAIIHMRIVKGDILNISFLAKGAGSENMSALYMLTPSKGRHGIIDSVLDCVMRAGANPCPPIIIGLGIGGDMEQACILAKQALLRPTGENSPDVELAALEQEILNAVNGLGIGVQGFGGVNTALSVAALSAPTHIGMLPVAVNIQCHSVRHATVEL